MGNIENEEGFKIFMEKFGPKSIASRSNYISWLKFISKNGFEINNKIISNNEILDFLRLSEDKRDKYKSKDAYSDFGSALNKYREFVNSDYNLILKDFINIDSESIPETEKRN